MRHQVIPSKRPSASWLTRHRHVASVSCLVAVLVASGAAHALTPKEQAKEAYERGTAAHKRGDYPAAARAFAEADGALPSDVALGAALDAAILADDPVLGSELLERSERSSPTGALKDLVPKARAQFAGRAARVRLICEPGLTECLGSVSGASLPRDRALWVRVGQHQAVVQVNGASKVTLLQLAAGELRELRGEAPKAPDPVPVPVPPSTAADPKASPTPTANAAPAAGVAPPQSNVAPVPTAPKAADPSGLPPIVFYSGLGLTALLGGASIAATLYTKGLHDDFLAAGCQGTAPPSDCKSKADAGESWQTGALVGFGATALVGVASVVIGLGFTRWQTEGPRVSITPGGAVAGYQGHF